jgi:hypothetical protein
MVVTDQETGSEITVPFDATAFEGTVGYEHSGPYRVEYCACGEKRVVPLKADEARELALRTGRLVEDTLDLTQRSESSGS